MVTRIFWIVLAIALVAAPVKAEPIKVAYSGVSASGTPLWLAKEDGIFAKHGLEADLVTVRSAPIQVSALISNEVQFVRGSASSMLTAAAQGAKLKILFSLFAERASYDFLVAPAITKPSDLRGKKVGVQDFSGLLWSLTMLSLREMGSTRKETTLAFRPSATARSSPKLWRRELSTPRRSINCNLCGFRGWELKCSLT